LNWTTAGK